MGAGAVGCGSRCWIESIDQLIGLRSFTCILAPTQPNSGQVIEIFGLAEHLLTECEFKDAYAPCPKSGLAVRRDQLEVGKMVDCVNVML